MFAPEAGESSTPPGCSLLWYRRPTRKNDWAMARTTLRRDPPNKTDSPFDLTGAQWSTLSDRRKTHYVNAALRYWRRKGFPYYRLSVGDMLAEVARLKALDARDVFRGAGIHGSNAGVRLASCFHPQIWSVRVSRYKSPIDCFRDDRCLAAAIRRAFTVWPDRHGANASCLRRMLKSFSNCAAVSNFRPAVARALIQKFSADNDMVVDFAAGYGGRLVGCLTLPRHYLGIEPCRAQVCGLKRCMEVLGSLGVTRGSAEIREGCAEEILPTVASRSAGLVFSSPPYFDWEKYSSHRTQSSVRYKTYSEWLEGFLYPVVSQSHRVLVRGGHLAVNAPNGQSRLSLLEDLTHAAKTVGFRLRRVYKLRLSKIPFLHPRGHGAKWEAVAVFQK